MRLPTFFLCAAAGLSCGGATSGGAGAGAPSSPPGAPAAGTRGTPTFAEDAAFLSAHGAIVTLEDPDGGRVAVSPKFQGRVMTSAVEPSGQSLGWVNRAFIESGKTGTPFDNYGGEDRFWLGPEGGQYGLYFPPGKAFEFDAWQTPHEMQEGAWEIAGADARGIAFHRRMNVTNWSRARFTVDVDRRIRLLSRHDVAAVLGVEPPAGAKLVAFESQNKITNAGDAPMKKDTGLVSIWILAMFAPASDARVVIPFEPEAGDAPIVNDRYFGKVPAERLRVDRARGHLYFTCDGKLRSKIGLGPVRARQVLGSYSPSAHLLTVVHYDKPKGPAPYVNSMWERQADPYGGDVVNSYNDGPTGPGKPPLGGFYELETSSPGAELAPGGSIVHTHRTFHFVGAPEVLDPIAKAVLGTSLEEIAR